MDLLMSAAKEYGKLVNHEYIIYFSNGALLRLIFKSGNFKHLAGLDKLDDLYIISSKTYSAIQIYRMVMRGELSLYDLHVSKKYSPDSKERLESLCRISEVLVPSTKVAYCFDKTKCNFRVSFKSDMIFFKDDGYNFFITFGAAKDASGDFYYPETVFYRFDESYIKNQTIVFIENISCKAIS